MTRPLRKILVAILLTGLAGCAGLPEYAAPKQVTIDYDESAPRDSIAYRSLKRNDFRGTEPPPEFDERMAAVTCAHIEPLIDREGIAIVEAPMADGSDGYHITLNNLKFRALLDRNCSWWNPAVSDLDVDYILRHEQIHFALFEVAARDWTEAPPVELRVEAGSRAEMLAKMRRQFEQHLENKMDELLALNREFDEQTSVGYNPEKQKEWWREVQARLAATAATGREIIDAANARDLAEAAEAALSDDAAVATVDDNGLRPCPESPGEIWDDCFGTYLQPESSRREGDKYVGEFRNDNFHGHGTYYFLADGEWQGDRYVGEFKNGRFDGYGVYTFANGESQQGYWRNNEFVQEQSRAGDAGQ
jgi:hypothetical protein